MIPDQIDRIQSQIDDQYASWMEAEILRLEMQEEEKRKVEMEVA